MKEFSTPESSPLVSVITVNLDGERYLGDLLDSLAKQTYPNLEVLVVDNGSTDGSETLVRRSFPQVRWIDAGANLGFAGGNNLGIQQSRGRYVALINNDTVIDPGWLGWLVEEARSSSDIGAVGSKILFARTFVPVTLEVATFRPSISEVPKDTRDLGVFLAEASHFEDCSYRKPVFHSGFYGRERIEGERGCWTRQIATVFLPVESPSEPGRLLLRLWGGADSEPRQLRVRIGDTEVASLGIGPGWQTQRIVISSALVRHAGFDVINNAASFLEDDGMTGDRGIYEPDRGQYDTAQDVSALCGCSMLLRRSVLNEVGLFDEGFFMYFEDTEMSWRLRKAGYRLRYQPKSIVRHYHASTSVEWSPLFNFLVSRNRILMLIRHASPRHAIRACLREIYWLGRILMTRRSLRDPEVRTRLRVLVSLLIQGPRSMWKRAVDRFAA